MNRFAVDDGWRILLTDLGIPAGEVLALAELPADLLKRKDSSVTVAEYFRLWQALDRLGGDPELPIRILQALSPEMFSPPLFAALCSPSLASAVGRIQQFKPLIGPMELDVRDAPSGLTLDIRINGSSLPMPRIMAATELGYFVWLARLATRHHVVPERLVSPVPLEPGAAFKAYFGCRVETGKSLHLRFSSEDARRPFVTRNDALWSFFEPGLRQRLEEVRFDGSLSERVRSALLEAIPAGMTSSDSVARKLALSKRTLQRRLEAENTSFSELLAQVREELARYYIRHTDLPYAQISFLLGYQDPNSFHRAFGAWTGTTPEFVKFS